tara:strand:+ start:123 stop:1235 length:1113 start_codon:yes stop_codon:yes gene_type:complete
MKICFVLATRPEIIKTSPVIKIFKKNKINFFLIHTGQHYTNYLDKIFFRELGLAKPKYNLKIKSKNPINEAEHTGRMMIKLENIILKEMPDIVIVHGDTNTTLAGALTVSKLFTKINFLNKRIKLAHLEAGLRSYDDLMPEETNRVVADHLSDILYVPTKISFNNLKKENLHQKKDILITGNTVVESLRDSLKIAKKINTLKKFKLKKNNYFLTTLHRPETVDNKNRLKQLLKTFDKLSKKYYMPVIFPIHPRTKKNVKKFKLTTKNIYFIEPVSYANFINLQKNAKLVFTDSGGVQEESCILQTPCLTIRNNTERPETVNVGGNIICGYSPNKIIKFANIMFKKKRKWKVPLGAGNTSQIILKHLKSIL